MNVQGLAAWVQAQMVAEPPAVLLVVRHTRSGGTGGVLGKVKIKPETHPEEVAQVIAVDLEADASAWQGRQTYVVYAHSAESTEAIGRRSIAITAPEEDTGDGPTEDSTPKGLFSQLMRHNEASARQAQAAFEMSARMMQSFSEYTSKRMEYLETSHMATMELAANATMELARIQADNQADQATLEQKERLLKMGEQVLPIVLMKLSEGKK